MVLRVVDIVGAIDRFLAGEVTAQQLEDWANRHEAVDDVDYATEDRDTIAEALFDLSNPSINGALTAQRVLAIRAEILRSTYEHG